MDDNHKNVETQGSDVNQRVAETYIGGVNRIEGGNQGKTVNHGCEPFQS